MKLLIRLLFIFLFSALFLVILFVPRKSKFYQIDVAQNSATMGVIKVKTVVKQDFTPAVYNDETKEEVTIENIIDDTTDYIVDEIIEEIGVDEPVVAEQPEIEPYNELNNASDSVVESERVEYLHDSSDIVYKGDFIDLNKSSTKNLVMPVIDFKTIYNRIVYPPAMKKKNVQLTVFLTVYVDKSGKITLEFPQDTPKDFENSICRAFEKVIVESAKLDGQNVPCCFVLPIKFELT